MNQAFWPQAIYIVFLIYLGSFLLVTLFYISLACFGYLENRKRAYQQEAEAYPLIYFSELAIPVSIILPAHNEEEWIRDSLLSLVNLNYPVFEVIVVDDGSTDKTLKVLDGVLELKTVDTIYTKHYADGNVISISRSVKYPGVTVVHKQAGGNKAGAINAGLNVAKHRFSCVIDADTVLERDALLRVMAQVHRDPERIIGIGSSFGLVNGFKIKDGIIQERNCSANPLIAYQNLEYIRAFIGNRLAWSRFNTMPIISGGFGIWRSDVLYELGGFSKDFSCEDLEFTFRGHEFMANNKEKQYKILMMPYYVGWTEGPANVSALIQQRDRWQRVTIETIVKYKHIMCNLKYGSFAFFVFPYFLFYEVLGTLFEVFSLLLVVLGFITKMIDLRTFLLYLAFMALMQFIISLLSLIAFMRGQRVFKIGYILYMAMLSLFEFFGYRMIISAGKLRGIYHYMCDIRFQDQYARGKRAV